MYLYIFTRNLIIYIEFVSKSNLTHTKDTKTFLYSLNIIFTNNIIFFLENPFIYVKCKFFIFSAYILLGAWVPISRPTGTTFPPPLLYSNGRSQLNPSIIFHFSWDKSEF
jgi:hypothetical protein